MFDTVLNKFNIVIRKLREEPDHVNPFAAYMRNVSEIINVYERVMRSVTDDQPNI